MASGGQLIEKRPKMAIVPTHFKRSKKYILNFVTDEEEIEDVERLQSILVEQFKARLLTLADYEEVLIDEDDDDVERSLILIAHCVKNPSKYHAITESTPIPFPGYDESKNSSQSSLPVRSYHSPEDLTPSDWGLYSSKETTMESFVMTMSRFMNDLDSELKNKLVIYPCVSDSSYSDGGRYKKLAWESNDCLLSNCNKFLLYLNDLMKDKARPLPPRKEQKKIQQEHQNSFERQEQQQQQQGQRRGDTKDYEETIPINNVTTFTNIGEEHFSRNFPDLNFYATQKYFLSLITDSNVEVEKIRSVVVDDYGAIEITVDNYEEIMKGKDGKVR